LTPSASAAWPRVVSRQVIDEVGVAQRCADTLGAGGHAGEDLQVHADATNVAAAAARPELTGAHRTVGLASAQPPAAQGVTMAARATRPQAVVLNSAATFCGS